MSPGRDGLADHAAGSEDTEERLNEVLIEMAELQDRIWDGLEALSNQGSLTPGLEEHARKVMDDVSYWIDQCTAPSESPPVLLRRIEVQLSRLKKILELIERGGPKNN